MKRYVFKNISEWVSGNATKSLDAEELVTGLKIYTGSDEKGVMFFHRPFYAKLNRRNLIIRQHPNKRNDEMIINLNKIAHTREQLKAILLGSSDGGQEALDEIENIEDQLVTIETEIGQLELDIDAVVSQISLDNDFIDGVHRITGEFRNAAGSTHDIWRYDFIEQVVNQEIIMPFSEPDDIITVIGQNVRLFHNDDVNGNVQVMDVWNRYLGGSQTIARFYWDGVNGSRQLMFTMGDDSAAANRSAVMVSMYYIKANNVID